MAKITIFTFKKHVESKETGHTDIDGAIAPDFKYMQERLGQDRIAQGEVTRAAVGMKNGSTGFTRLKIWRRQKPPNKEVESSSEAKG